MCVHRLRWIYKYEKKFYLSIFHPKIFGHLSIIFNRKVNIINIKKKSTQKENFKAKFKNFYIKNSIKKTRYFQEFLKK